MSDIQKAAEIIQDGGLVAFPTETVYGLGADALNPYAVAAIFEAKNRPTFDPLIVHVADMRQAEILVHRFPEKALKLIEKFWPGPLTIVLPKSSLVPD
ncbi:MAG TPA: L-threonylcarbamoyladenylate synthase, partial [bacterium]|nr:L-threonylcarbamoyladenylate synthase [bacterium]